MDMEKLKLKAGTKAEKSGFIVWKEMCHNKIKIKIQVITKLMK
jgi:hypothetical protein